MKQRLVLAVFALLIAAPCVGAQAVSSQDELTLSLRIKSRHIDYFETCMPVRVNSPFRIVWGGETVQSFVSGTISGPVAGEYSTKLMISEGNGQCRTKTTQTLKLDEPNESTNVVSSLFKHFDTYRFVLSKKPCDVAEANRQAP